VLGAHLGACGEQFAILETDDVFVLERPREARQPVPESNLSRELKSGSPEATST